jgi:hypothetical protein
MPLIGYAARLPGTQTGITIPPHVTSRTNLNFTFVAQNSGDFEIPTGLWNDYQYTVPYTGTYVVTAYVELLDHDDISPEINRSLNVVINGDPGPFQLAPLSGAIARRHMKRNVQDLGDDDFHVSGVLYLKAGDTLQASLDFGSNTNVQYTVRASSFSYFNIHLLSADEP